MTHNETNDEHRTAIQAELESIREAHGGLLCGEDVVDFARDADTALHAEFEWDDTEAAKQYRLVQARHIIRVQITILPGSQREVQTYVSLKVDRAQPRGGYRRVEDVMGDDELRAQLLREARADISAFQRKYDGLKELAGVLAAMEVAELDNAAG